MARCSDPSGNAGRGRFRVRFLAAYGERLWQPNNADGNAWAAVADQAPTIYAVWGGGATPAQALYMVGLILPPKAP
jgi:hypothetical protein